MNLDRTDERTPICKCGHSEDDHREENQDLFECLVCQCARWYE